jgi:hypothetical protein
LHPTSGSPGSRPATLPRSLDVSGEPTVHPPDPRGRAKYPSPQSRVTEARSRGPVTNRPSLECIDGAHRRASRALGERDA